MATPSESGSKNCTVLVLIEPDPGKLDPAYEGFDTPISLPPSSFPKDSTRQSKEILHDESRSVYQQLMKGENVHLEAIETEFEGEASVTIVYRLEPGDDETPPLGYYVLARHPNENGCTVGCVNHSAMQSNVPDYLIDISSQRLTHWLVRQHLTKLSEEAIRLCFDYLVTRMGETGLWKDLYDVAVLRCKWILAVRPRTGGWKDGQFGAINTIGDRKSVV